MKIRPRPRYLLYIEPSSQASDEPVVDVLTRKMVAAYRQGTGPGYTFFGFHWCICGTASKATDTILPSGETTNSLCVHYLAHHRADVPVEELAKVERLDCGEAEPTWDELWGMSPVLRQDPDAEPPRERGDSGVVQPARRPWWRFWR